MKKRIRVLSLLLALLVAFSFTTAAANALTITSAKYNDVDLEGATVPAGGEIRIVFSNNVTEDENNFGKIKVRNAEDNVVDASVSVVDKNTFAITLGSDLPKGSYTLTIGKDLTAKNGTTLGYKAVYNFTVKGSGSGTGGGINPLTVEFVKSGDIDLNGAELNGNEAIVIHFSRGMTENAQTNASLIQVLDAEGSPAEYTVSSPENKDDDNAKKEYTVQLNNLNDGSYTLVIGANVKANNGNTLGEDVRIAFRVKAEEPEELTVLERIKQFFVNLFEQIVTFFANMNWTAPSWFYTIKEWVVGLFA